MRWGGKYAGFDIAADFLQHSLDKEPEKLVIKEGKVVEKIKIDNNFKETVKKIVQKYGQNKEYFEFDSKIDNTFPLIFSSGDLYYAINKVNFKIYGNKKDEKWNLRIILSDRYDYTEFKKIKQYIGDTNSLLKSMFSSTIYNFAHFSIIFGVMKEYDIEIIIDNYEVV